MNKLTIIFILLIAVGYYLPAVNVHLSFLGITQTYDFSLPSLFEEEGAFGRLNLNESDLSEILSESEVVQDISQRIIISVVFYFLSLVFFVASIILIIKKRVVFAIAANIDALICYSISAYAILSVPEKVALALDDFLGIFARFINTNEVLQIELASGFWITLSAMGLMLIVQLLNFFIRRNHYE